MLAARTTPIPTTDAVTWRDEAIVAAILYRLLECGEKIPLYTEGTDFAFIESYLDRMHARDLLRIDGTQWAVAKAGKEVFAKLVAMYDQVIKFEIFSAVDLTRSLRPDECQVAPDDALDDEKWRASLMALDYVYDPRFRKTPAAEDLRLAMIAFLAESAQREGKLADTLDLHRVVLIQKLVDGLFKSKTFWSDLRTKFLVEVDQIVESAYKWRDIAETEEESAAVMEVLYRAGMLEQRKRAPGAKECSRCKIPLAVFAFLAQEAGETFNQCPNPDCQASFTPLPSVETEFECPNCRAGIRRGQRYCDCGARVDFSLPPGTTRTVTTEETEVVCEPWGCDTYAVYDVVPYGYYNPWDPWADLVAFSVLAAVLW